ncbi:MAG: GTP 3',8-cyclase MoaA [Planctomycetota bacterium]|jgi:cyclic pyranopterin phosphate synthase
MFDRFQRRIDYLRLSVTDLCNLRCTYCMPPEGVPLKRHEEILSLEEMEEVVRVAVELGVTKVRLTGGEPLVRRNILYLVERIGQIQGIHDFAMTTNGMHLPQFAKSLKKAGLMRINISLDTLDPGRFSELTRGGDVHETLAGIEAAMTAGLSPVKLNCVIESSVEEKDAQAVAAYGRERGLEVRYIRRMCTRDGVFGRVIGGDGGHCETCNRIRVTCDGRVYPCLFSDRFTSVRELGPQQAFLAAVGLKPAAGVRSENQFYAMGG